MEKHYSLEAFFEERLALDLLHDMEGTYYIDPEERLKNEIKKRLKNSGLDPLKAEAQYIRLKHKSISLGILQKEVKLLSIKENMEELRELIPSLKSEKAQMGKSDIQSRASSSLRIKKKGYEDLRDFENDLEFLIQATGLSSRIKDARYPKKTREVACKTIIREMLGMMRRSKKFKELKKDIGISWNDLFILSLRIAIPQRKCIPSPSRVRITFEDIKAFLNLELSKKGKEVQAKPAKMEKLAKELTGKEVKATAYYTLRKPKRRFEEIILPEEIKEEIKLLLDTHNKSIENHILNQSYGKGSIFHFYGKPGTGKTAMAEAIANYLQKPLLVADKGKLLSMWVGETEKNIERAFREARELQAVLFFDEVDSLLASRKTAVRRWEASFVNTFLTEIERFDGVCILACNYTEVLDEALERRILYAVEFPQPDKQARIEIFKLHFPNREVLAEDIGFEELAEQELSGGDIKNIAILSARLSIAEGSPKIEQKHLRKAYEMLLRRKGKGPNLSYVR